MLKLEIKLDEAKIKSEHKYDVISNMSEVFPWLHFCVSNFEVTNIGRNHDMLDLFTGEAEEIESLP